MTSHKPGTATARILAVSYPLYAMLFDLQRLNGIRIVEDP